MHVVNQITPFTCGLACIESVSTDLGIAVTQCELMVRFKAELLADVADYGDFGATSPNLLQAIWQQVGLQGQWIKNHDVQQVRAIFGQLQANQAVLIFSNLQQRGWHCVRLIGLNGPHGIDLLVPIFLQNSPAVLTVSGQDLVSWDFFFALVSR